MEKNELKKLFKLCIKIKNEFKVKITQESGNKFETLF